jgi:periplasmic divalent cation tolerance protein
MAFIIVYITHPDENCARQVSEYLLEEKLAACSNIFPIRSAYWWKNAIQQEEEWVSIVKTTSENWSAVQKAVENKHPYAVPCIMKINVEANEAYENWIATSVHSAENPT